VNATTIVVDSNGFTFDAGDHIKVEAIYTAGTNNQVVSGSSQFETAWFADTATTTVAHGRTDIEDIKGYIVQEWDVATGRRRNIDTSGLVADFDGTNLYLDWAGFTPSATLKYRVTTSGHFLPQSVPMYLGGYTKFVGFGPNSYGTLESALASAVSGDSILVNKSYTATATETLSTNDVKVTFMPGAKVSYSTNTTKGLAVSGNRVSVSGYYAEFTGTGTMSSFVEVSGDDCLVENTRVVLNNAGLTVTAAYNVTAAADRARVYGSLNASAGTVTSALTDAGTSTDYTITT
jgi:hypothetical protein